jgi:hypothetical protein
MLAEAAGLKVIRELAAVVSCGRGVRLTNILYDAAEKCASAESHFCYCKDSCAA